MNIPREHCEKIHDRLDVFSGTMTRDGKVIRARGSGLEGLRKQRSHLRDICEPDRHPNLANAIEQAMEDDEADLEIVEFFDDQLWAAKMHLWYEEEAQSLQFIGRDISEEHRLQRDLIDCADAEQRRLGQDLHDSLGQYLTGVSFLLRTLQTKVGTATKNLFEGDFSEASEQLNISLWQIRALANGMSHDIAVDEFEQRLDDLAQYFHKIFDVRVILHKDLQEPLHCDTACRNLFRIIQESLTNATKHGNATEVTVSIQTSATDGNILTIRDNGNGKLPKKTPRGRMGMKIMRYRASAIGATLEWRRPPEGGIEVVCHFPNRTTDDCES